MAEEDLPPEILELKQDIERARFPFRDQFEDLMRRPTMSWKIREHRGSLVDSLETTREIGGMEELVALINGQFELYGGTRRATPDQVHVEPYAPDPRCGWNTYIITVDGYGVWGMADGPAPQ